jgi:hypothetical protein
MGGHSDSWWSQSFLRYTVFGEESRVTCYLRPHHVSVLLQMVCRLKAAAGQLLVTAVILAGGALYTHHRVTSLHRADFTQLEYFEDSKAGE